MSNIYASMFEGIVSSIDIIGGKMPSGKNIPTQLLSNNACPAFELGIGKIKILCPGGTTFCPGEGKSYSDIVKFNPKESVFVLSGGSKEGAGHAWSVLQKDCKANPQFIVAFWGYELSCQLGAGLRSFASALRAASLQPLVLLKGKIEFTILLSDESEKKVYKYTLEDSDTRALVSSWQWRLKPLANIESAKVTTSKIRGAVTDKATSDFLKSLDLS